MLKTLYQQIGEYKKESVLPPVFSALEVLMEILIPFVTASIIDKGISAGNMQKVCRTLCRRRFFRLCLQSAGRDVCQYSNLLLFQY